MNIWISGYRYMDYWSALKSLGLYSLQRRRERYQIIYIWSILEGRVPNILTRDGTPLISVKSHSNMRRGRTISLPTLKRSRYSKLRYDSFPFHGARLFNAMPNFLRSLTHISKDSFKTQLDECLKLISDEPQIQHYTPFRRAPSNSIVHMRTTANWSKSAMGCGF